MLNLQWTSDKVKNFVMYLSNQNFFNKASWLGVDYFLQEYDCLQKEKELIPGKIYKIECLIGKEKYEVLGRYKFEEHECYMFFDVVILDPLKGGIFRYGTERSEFIELELIKSISDASKTEKEYLIRLELEGGYFH